MYVTFDEALNLPVKNLNEFIHIITHCFENIKNIVGVLLLWKLQFDKYIH